MCLKPYIHGSSSTLVRRKWRYFECRGFHWDVHLSLPTGMTWTPFPTDVPALSRGCLPAQGWLGPSHPWAGGHTQLSPACVVGLTPRAVPAHSLSLPPRIAPPPPFTDVPDPRPGRLENGPGFYWTNYMSFCVETSRTSIYCAVRLRPNLLRLWS